MKTAFEFAAYVAIFVLLGALDHFGLGQTAEEQAGCIPAATGYVYRNTSTGALGKCVRE